jgi:hypothetical protein
VKGGGLKTIGFLIIGFTIATSVYADVIYGAQTYDYDETVNGFSIYGAEGYETADDFETTQDWTLEMVRFWVFYTVEQDIRVDIFSNSGGQPAGDPPGDLYNEEVAYSYITWTDTGDSMYGYPIYKVDVPLTGFIIDASTRYWLGLQSLTGGYSSWLQLDRQGCWYDTLIYHNGDWYDPSGHHASEFELHGTPKDYEEPDVTQTHPHDSDYPSGVPIGTNVTFHVIDDVSGCDTDETTCTVEDSGSAVPGALTFDDSDPLDVAFTWEPDDDYTEGASIDVEVVTYDLAGNGPVTEDWTFTTGYVNIVPKSLGVIKARFAE